MQVGGFLCSWVWDGPCHIQGTDSSLSRIRPAVRGIGTSTKKREGDDVLISLESSGWCFRLFYKQTPETRMHLPLCAFTGLLLLLPPPIPAAFADDAPTHHDIAVAVEKDR